MFFHMYPYTDAHELNLDWLLAQIKAINSTLNNFIVMNTIKYADPFQWNITTQYESNTIVMEPNTGVAYISTKPVPAGISISNTDFWTAVFDLSQLFSNFNDNITFHNEYLNIVSAHVYAADDWLIWKNELYLVTAAISLGDALQPGTNIQRKTVEELVDDLKTALELSISNLSDVVDDNTADITSIKNEIAGYVKIFDSLTDLEAANLAIGEKAVTVMNSVPVSYTIASSAGASDYSIALDNGLVAIVDHVEVHVKGLITNMGSDCSTLVNDLISKNYPLFFDYGTYFLNMIIPTNTTANIRGCGEYSVFEPATDNNIITINSGYLVTIKDIRLQSIIHFNDWTNVGGIKINNASKCLFENILIENTHGGIFSRGGLLWCTFRSIHVYGCHGVGYRFEALAAGDQINNNNFIACEMTTSTIHGWYFQDNNSQSWGNNMIGCTCELTGNNIGIFNGDGTNHAILLSGVQVKIDGCYIEACNSAAIIRSTYRCLVKNCSFISISNPIFELIGSYDQAVWVDNNGFNVTGTLYSGGSGTVTRTEGNVGLPTV